MTDLKTMREKFSKYLREYTLLDKQIINILDVIKHNKETDDYFFPEYVGRDTPIYLSPNGARIWITKENQLVIDNKSNLEKELKKSLMNII